MFITYNPNGLVTAYSDKLRSVADLALNELQAEVDYPYKHIDCKAGGLTFINGQLLNDGLVIANQIRR